MDRAGENNYYHYDGLGSVRQITDDSETIVASYVYEAFGNLVASSGSGENTYGFTGEQQFGEADNLVFLRARYYDPRIGRFISRDPMPTMGGLNLYVYARNNPVNYVDPLGLFCIPLPSQKSAWSNVGAPYSITISVTAVFTDLTGPLGTCMWSKNATQNQERTVTSRTLCCNWDKCEGMKCRIKTGPSAKESQSVRILLDSASTPAIRLHTARGESWTCRNPFGGPPAGGDMPPGP